MMKYYQVNGMTCSNCEASVKKALLSVSGVRNVEVSREKNQAEITSDKPLNIAILREALPEKYEISEVLSQENKTPSLSRWETYKPIWLIFTYISGITLMIQLSKDSFDIMEWMRHFMAGFFLVFSFFKMLNLKGFAESYVMYDVVARRFPVWAYIYAFTELGLGIAYIVGFYPLLTYTITLVVMSVSIVGVLQSVLNKREIQCACLGAVFNLPMSTVTIIEDVLMIVMSVFMILTL